MDIATIPSFVFVMKTFMERSVKKSSFVQTNVLITGTVSGAFAHAMLVSRVLIVEL